MAAVVAYAVLFASGAAAHDSLGATMGTVDRGAVNSFTAPNGLVLSAPWVRKYFANAGQCLAFDMLAPMPADLELVVISPDPSIRYRNDDRGRPADRNVPNMSVSQNRSNSDYWTLYRDCQPLVRIACDR